MSNVPLPRPGPLGLIQYAGSDMQEYAAAVSAAKDAEIAGLREVIDAARRLVEHADFQLGGILSADSKAKDIPSKAVSQVKARHLASLRDRLAALGDKT